MSKLVVYFADSFLNDFFTLTHNPAWRLARMHALAIIKDAEPGREAPRCHDISVT